MEDNAEFGVFVLLHSKHGGVLCQRPAPAEHLPLVVLLWCELVMWRSAPNDRPGNTSNRPRRVGQLPQFGYATALTMTRKCEVCRDSSARHAHMLQEI